LWNQFLEYLTKKLFDVLKWIKELKQIICFYLSGRKRGAARDKIRTVFFGTEPTSPMTTMWYTEEG